MSVLVEFAMFPTDKGESVSEYVSKIIKMMKDNGIKYQLTPMGTIFECEKIENALDIIKESYIVLEPYSNRVYCAIKMDIRKDRIDGMKSKIASIKQKI